MSVAIRPLKGLLAEAWEVSRRHFPARLTVSAPGNKRYSAGGYRNRPACFPTVSVTGRACALRCAHCGGRLLEGMVPAGSPAEFLRLIRTLRDRGAAGILVTGGCNADGEVPLAPYLEGLRLAAELGMSVLVHTGLATRETAAGLKRAGVGQVLLDLIGDAATIREVYRLDRSPGDYRASLEALLAEGLTVVPHIVMGLHRGAIRGEYEALEWVAELRPAGPAGLVLVALSPLPGTELAACRPPDPEEAGRLLANARLRLPDLPLSLGCARPAGAARLALERYAVDAGVNAIAYPAGETLRYAAERGLALDYREECCSLPA